MHPFQTFHPLQSVPFYRERSTRTTLGSLLVVLLLRCAALLARGGRVGSICSTRCYGRIVSPGILHGTACFEALLWFGWFDATQDGTRSPGQAEGGANAYLHTNVLPLCICRHVRKPFLASRAGLHTTTWPS